MNTDRFSLPLGDFNLPPGVSLSDVDPPTRLCDWCGSEHVAHPDDNPDAIGLCPQCEAAANAQ